jgi:hypothetical protein
MRQSTNKQFLSGHFPEMSWIIADRDSRTSRDLPEKPFHSAGNDSLSSFSKAWGENGEAARDTVCGSSDPTHSNPVSLVSAADNQSSSWEPLIVAPGAVPLCQ